MDRFNSNEPIEETPVSIAKDIIYSDSTKQDQVGQIVNALAKTNTNPIDQAEAQLLGFFHASKGYSLFDLITGMGLTAEEWGYMKGHYQLTYLSEEDKEQIDNMFNSN